MSNLATLRASAETCTGHRLRDYDGKCAHPHGHNYLWELELELPVEDLKYGMAEDFSFVKSVLESVVQPYDHSFVLRDDDRDLIQHLLDHKNRLVVLDVNPTAENLAKMVADVLYLQFSSRGRVAVTLHETRKYSVRVVGDANESRIHVIGVYL